MSMRKPAVKSSNSSGGQSYFIPETANDHSQAADSQWNLGFSMRYKDSGGNAMKIPHRDSLRAFALPAIAMTLAVIVAYPVHSFIPYSAEYLFLIAVVLTAWFASRGPGLVAVILAPLALDCFFLPIEKEG